MSSKIAIPISYKPKHEMSQHLPPVHVSSIIPHPNRCDKQFLKQTSIIFDWDDTLLASTHLCNTGIDLQSQMMPKELFNQFKKLEEYVVSLLTSAKQYSHNVFIITNAETGWVELSSLKFMPKVHHILNGIQIISAKSTYGHLFEHIPNTTKPNSWKAYAFDTNIQYDKSSEMNIISFGDSEYERNAILNMCKSRVNCRYKSIKFIERPTIDQLQRQIEMINSNLKYIVNHDGNLDLMLTITVTGKQNEQHTSTETVTLPNVSQYYARAEQ